LLGKILLLWGSNDHGRLYKGRSLRGQNKQVLPYISLYNVSLLWSSQYGRWGKGSCNNSAQYQLIELYIRPHFSLGLD
jgi:hypothetical protein